MVVAALLHDIGDLLSPHDHGEIAAAILKPIVSPTTYWIVRYHPIFQGYFFFDKIGKNPHERERYRGHPAFEPTAHFCERYDQVAFDINYPTMPLEAFEPMVRRVFARQPWAQWRDEPRNAA
jgi:predicted HD phosphohydrolase